MPTPRIALLLAVAATLGACSSSTEVNHGPASLRVVNASSVALNVVVDGKELLTGLAASKVSAPIEITSGSHELRLQNAGGASNATFTLQADGGGVVTAVATSQATTLSASVLVDTGSTVLPGRSKLRVLHLAPSAIGVQGWRTQPGVTSAVQVSIPFEFGLVTPYIQADSGKWEVWVSTPKAPTAKLATTGILDIPGGERRTVALVDSSGTLVFRVISN
ncbi:MAG: hypothetical protein JWO05_806 [Gemmatimonadetes bacterium]|nr:hypothetical protein [Gemmatimonadota bacterium]